jgi:hypothetical protein
MTKGYLLVVTSGFSVEKQECRLKYEKVEGGLSYGDHGRDRKSRHCGNSAKFS